MSQSPSKDVNPFSYSEDISALYKQGILSFFDLYFAKTLLPCKSLEDTALLLAYLLCISRKGHLCLSFKGNRVLPIIPDIQDPTFSEKLKKGLQNLPSSLYEKMQPQSTSTEKPLCWFDEKLYLQKSWIYETQICNHIPRLLSYTNSAHIADLSLEGLLPEQKKAVCKALQNPITFILGGPGTGKTFTASHLLQTYTKLYPNSSIVVTAPTGKASYHLEQKLNVPCTATTLHSLLKLRANQKISFQEECLPYDLILVDEASMIDAKVMAYLFSKIKKGAKLILIGDPFQLPPVEAGSLFSDLVITFPNLCVTLQKAVRFEKEELYSFSQAVLQNDKKALDTLLQSEAISHISWPFSSRLPTSFYEYVKQFYMSCNSVEEFFEKQNTFRILSPLRKGPWGVDSLNLQLYEYFRAAASPFSPWFIPILITQNDSKKGLFNGMTGVLITHKKQGLVASGQKAYFYIEGKLQALSSYQLPSFELGYALSVHKSQGSEYDHIFLIIPPKARMAGKEVFYTAATRAKKKLSIWGEKTHILSLLDLSLERVSGLPDRFTYFVE